MAVSITFLGASGTVTGSKYLVRTEKVSILVDAGMFQGSREWRVKNWDAQPFDLSKVDAVLLTHAHIDHIGMLPRFYAFGLKCPIYGTTATVDLAELLLIDSAKLQEEEASFREESGKSRHKPALPLYTEEDALASLKYLKGVPYNSPQTIADGVKATWTQAGHIMGAACIRLEIGGKIINFSGDLGRYHVPILADPISVQYGDLLLVESTYGNRLHSKDSPKEKLAQIVNQTVNRGGVVVIPSFAVGRTQELLFYLRELKLEQKIPDVPIIVDSPMAQDATSIYMRHPECYDDGSKQLLKSGIKPFSPSKLYFSRDRSESIKINSIDDPMIIISASGMLTGGRILHHLKHRISSPLNTILFVGFQPPGGRGDWIKSGADSLRVFGQEVPIRASIEEISALSAHGDRDELMKWCREGKGKPGRVAVVHGEPDSAKAFSQTLAKDLQWNTFCPEYLQTITV